MLRIVINQGRRQIDTYPTELRDVVPQAAIEAAHREVSSWPGYELTPLRRLTGLASELGVSELWYKDEGARFGLGSFKALGGAYGVLHAIRDVLSSTSQMNVVSARDLLSGEHRKQVRDVTICCATDGNHGRAVAWACQRFGCRSVIYLHQHVSEPRERAIRALGAEIVRVIGNYDDAVTRAAADARDRGWRVVSDTSYDGYTAIPSRIMEGYGIIGLEALQQLPAQELPTHVFVQAGVGGLAAALCACLWQCLGARRPWFIVAEPTTAACLLASAARGRLSHVEGSLETIMAGLSCGVPSLVAWEILSRGADVFAAVDDASIPPIIRRLASPTGVDAAVEAGESAVTGLAALKALLLDLPQARALQLTSESRVLVIGTERATDPQMHRRILGGEL